MGSWASWLTPSVATDALSELAQQGITLRQLAGVAGADHAHEDRVTAALGNGLAQRQRGEGPPAALRERTQVGLSAVARGRRDLRQQCQVVLQRHIVWRGRRRAGALSDWAAVGATFGQLLGRPEVMRAMLDVRAAGIPVVAVVGGANGCFGGMGIAARCANTATANQAPGSWRGWRRGRAWGWQS